jgi:hypothetical protein
VYEAIVALKQHFAVDAKKADQVKVDKTAAGNKYLAKMKKERDFEANVEELRRYGIQP